MNDYPAMITPVNHVEPVPRRIRAFLAGREGAGHDPGTVRLGVAYYPQYYVPLADVRHDLLIPRGMPSRPAAERRNCTGCGPARRTGRGRPG